MRDDFLSACRTIIGNAHVLTMPADTISYLTDQRARYTGQALAVLKPGNCEEVAALVKLCCHSHTPIVPQGGNTGLVLGSVPDTSGCAVLLSLTRLNRIRAIDAVNHTMTVEAGCILKNVQQAAAAAARLFPLSLASEGSCTIGGNLSTNAGGSGVLRYGNARELCLGLEVVTATGEIMTSLRGLRKDNTGYDLRDLFIGAEGTLGIITAAVLKLYPQPQAQITALTALRTPEQALRLLMLAQTHWGAALTGFELMSAFCLDLVAQHCAPQRPPFPQPHAQYVLLEMSDSQSTTHASQRVESLISSALKQDIIDDAVIATSMAQAQALWQWRENISMAQARAGHNIKHDIAVPISCIGTFIQVTDALLQQAAPGCRMVTFGHLGDGNLHYNVAPPVGVKDTDFLAQQTLINRVVYDSVERFHGSIAAEHGLGALKREEILRYKSPVELQLMHAIKQALDPAGLMNPGKVIDASLKRILHP